MSYFRFVFFSSFGSKTVKVKNCFFVMLRNSYLRDEKQNTVESRSIVFEGDGENKR